MSDRRGVAPAPAVIRDSTVADYPVLLALNLESEHYLSPLSAARLAELHGAAACRRVVCADGVVQGFLLALREGSDYDSPNYRWFAARYARFLYIDRVVIAAAARGRQYGIRLYEDVCGLARVMGVERITCEYDTEPPNEGSRRFHARFGFREVGTQRVADGRKAVSLQELAL